MGDGYALAISHTGREENYGTQFWPHYLSIQRETLPKISLCIDPRRYLQANTQLQWQITVCSIIEQYIEMVF